MIRVSTMAVGLAMVLWAAGSAVAQKISLQNPAAFKDQAPETYQVRFDTSAGEFVIQVTRDWAPIGADRFYNLVKNGFYDGVRFYRAMPGFMAQFGVHGNPTVAAIWSRATIGADPVKQSNKPMFVTFAMGQKPDTRTTQLFINFRDNSSSLDRLGFAPIGEIISGKAAAAKIYTGYGDVVPRGKTGPDTARLYKEGNAYLEKEFPKLDFIKQATIEK